MIDKSTESNEPPTENTLLLEAEFLLTKKRKPFGESSSLRQKCRMCLEKEYKYKCPKCSIVTCSVQCVNLHKTLKSCNGLKPKFHNKKLTELSELDLKSDIKFLSSIINDSNNIGKQIFELTEDDNKRFKEKKQKNFGKLCKKFRSVEIIKCPVNLSKFNENKSYCDSKNQKFYWTVKLVFLEVENGTIRHLFEVLREAPFDDSINTLDMIVNSIKDNLTHLEANQIIYFNTKFDFNDYQIYYKVPKNTASLSDSVIEYQNSFLQNINKNVLLLDFLTNKTIYEFPDFYLISKKIN